VSGRVGVCMRVRACSLAYPACNACAPCCDVISGPFGCIIFDIVINSTIFWGKNVTEHKTCFDFLYNLCLEHFSF
jgi:hypothetical protein